MAFFNSAIDTLQTLVIALGAGLGAWGVINLLEGYGNDNPGANGQCPQGSSHPKYEKRQPQTFCMQDVHPVVRCPLLLYCTIFASLLTVRLTDLIDGLKCLGQNRIASGLADSKLTCKKSFPTLQQ